MAKKTEPPPFEVVAIDHIVLRTRRIDEVLGFYRDILGLPQERILKEIGSTSCVLGLVWSISSM